MVPSDYFAGVISAAVLALIVVLFLFVSTRNWFIVLVTTVVAAAVILFLYFFMQGGYRYPFRGIFSGFLQKFLGWFSLNRRYQNFSMGLLKFDSLIYYVSFSGLFLFLTVRLIEKRRWN
jgi:ABC-2 type transport system permease protein